MVDLRGRDFLKLLDFSTEEIEHLLNIAIRLKEMKKKSPEPKLGGSKCFSAIRITRRSR